MSRVKCSVGILLSLLFPVAVNAQTPAPTLIAGSRLERKIKGGEAHSYQLQVNPNEYVQLFVEQRGIDLIVKLFDAKGVQRAQMDSPNGAYGTEPLCFIADEKSTYRVEVRLLDAEASAGRYTIVMGDRRVAGPSDHLRFNAQQTFSEAERLRNEEKAEFADDALVKYDTAYALYSEVHDKRGAAISLYGRAAIYQAAGQQAKALENYDKSAQFWRAANDASARANTLNSLGLVADDLGQKQKSLAYYNQALVLFRRIGDEREIANTLANIGRLHVSFGNYARALGLFNNALKVFEARGELSETATMLTNLSVVHENLGNYDQAIAHTEQALEVQRRLGNKRGEAYALVSLANVHYGLGSFQKALDTYKSALVLFQQAGNGPLEGQTLNNIGKSYLMLGDSEQAMVNITRALEIARSLADRHRQAYYLNNVALLRQQSEQKSEAEQLYEEALAITRDVNNRHGEALILDNLGSLYLSTAQRREALNSFHRALTINRTLREVPEEGNTLAHLMLAWKSFQQPSLAILYGKQAVNRFQLVRRRIKVLTRELQLSYLASKETIYRELAELLIGQGRLPEAQQVLRMLKEEEYFWFVRGSSPGMANAVDIGLAGEEAEWAKRYSEISDQIAEIGRQRGELLAKQNRLPLEEQQLSNLEHDLEVANQRFQSFLDELETKFSNVPASNFRVTALRDTQALQSDLRELGPGTVALFTVVADEKFSVILVTPDVQLAREYPIKVADLNRKILEFRQLLQDKDSNPKPAAQDLYNILIAPVAKDLTQARARTLMWSLDGSLRYLPLNALYDGNAYLVERYKNVVFTPASNARLKDAPKPAWRGLGMGVSKEFGDFPALAAVPLELGSIIRGPGLQRVLKQPSSGVVSGKILLDEDFTLSAMRKELRQRYPLVHIASHFLFKPGNENDSFLLLGNGQHLTLREIKRAVTLFDGVDLLTLSACDTATGGVGADGKEVEGFAVLAQRQGAKSVMASLWPVSDNSTRLLMAEFYKLRTGSSRLSKAEALQQAQLSLLSNRANYKHPFFWAPFILIGNWK